MGWTRQSEFSLTHREMNRPRNNHWVDRHGLYRCWNNGNAVVDLGEPLCRCDQPSEVDVIESIDHYEVDDYDWIHHLAAADYDCHDDKKVVEARKRAPGASTEELHYEDPTGNCRRWKQVD